MVEWDEIGDASTILTPDSHDLIRCVFASSLQIRGFSGVLQMSLA